MENGVWILISIANLLEGVMTMIQLPDIYIDWFKI